MAVHLFRRDHRFLGAFSNRRFHPMFTPALPHRAYAKKAQVQLPALEEFEKAFAAKKLVAVEFGTPRDAQGEANSPTNR